MTPLKRRNSRLAISSWTGPSRSKSREQRDSVHTERVRVTERSHGAVRQGQTREQLLNDLWECDAEIGPRAIDRHICFLRAKLGPLRRYFETVPSAGYRLVAA